jgi:hypothetical protein
MSNRLSNGTLSKGEGKRGERGKRQPLGFKRSIKREWICGKRASALGVPKRCAPPNGPRLYFYIYYADKNQPQFRYAAETWCQEICRIDHFRQGLDRFLKLPAGFEQEFVSRWKNIRDFAAKDGYEVWAGNILTHATTSELVGDRSSTGLEFARNEPSHRKSGKESRATLTKQEIAVLPRLPWNRKFGFLLLSGCYTGVSAKRGWCPAAEFSICQKIQTVGTTRSTSFSTRFDVYSQISEKDTTIYLWSYETTSRQDLNTPGVPILTSPGPAVSTYMASATRYPKPANPKRLPGVVFSNC